MNRPHHYPMAAATYGFYLLNKFSQVILLFIQSEEPLI